MSTEDLGWEHTPESCVRLDAFPSPWKRNLWGRERGKEEGNNREMGRERKRKREREKKRESDKR